MGLITGQFLKQIRLNSGVSVVKIARITDKMEGATRRYETTVNISIDKIIERAKACNDTRVLNIISGLECLQNERSDYLCIPYKGGFSGSFLKQMRLFSNFNIYHMCKSGYNAILCEKATRLTVSMIRSYALVCEDVETLAIMQSLEDLQIERNKDLKCSINLKHGEQ